MFKEIAPGIIESTDGYQVDNYGHFEVRYIENGRAAKFYAEPGVQAHIYSLDVPVKW
jgi:hypothetical protein